MALEMLHTHSKLKNVVCTSCSLFCMLLYNFVGFFFLFYRMFIVVKNLQNKAALKTSKKDVKSGI